MIKFLKKIKKINILKTIYFNFFNKHIIKNKSKVIIYNGGNIQLEEGAKIYLNSNLAVGTNSIFFSKEKQQLD